MKKVVVIVGPTATGKTSLALKLCQKFNGEIISVDSRQAYKEMEIGTGKATIDNPSRQSRDEADGQLTNNKRKVPIHLYDLATPDQRLNAFDYSTKAWAKMAEILAKGEIPFLVGGTGFYLDVIFGRRKLSGVGADQKLREELENLSIPDLVEKLRQLDPKKLQMIDLNNKYRLIRAVEIGFLQGHPLPPARGGLREERPRDLQYLIVGLTAENEFLYKRADERVDLMVKSGLVEEVKRLVEKYGWQAPGLNSLGYREFKPYLEELMQLDPSYAGLQSEESSKRFRGVYTRTNTSLKGINIAVGRIKFDTHAYIRRQKTYFRKNSEIRWFNIQEPQFELEIENAVKSLLRS